MNPSRFILALVLIYEAVFLNIVLPGHTRGQITLDGKHSVDTRSACCCGQNSPTTNSPATPSQQDRNQCALCQFMAVLTSVPFIVLTLPELGLLESRPTPPPQVIESLERISTYLACGPPRSSLQA